MGRPALILVDTQAIVWYDAGDPRLGRDALQAVEDALGAGELLVSAISFCEVAWLHATRRLVLPQEPGRWRASILGEGAREVPIDGEVAIAAASLDWSHKDPADRLIVATALDEGARLLTSDRRILAWPGPLASLDARS